MIIIEKVVNRFIYFDRTCIKKATSGTIYSGVYTINLDNKQIQIKLKMIQFPTNDHSNTRIENWAISNDQKEMTNTFFKTKFLPVVTNIINICDSQFNFLLMHNEEHPDTFEVDLSKKQIVFPNNYELSELQIKKLIENSSNKLEMFDATFIDFLEDFIIEWNKKISEDASEIDFRNYLLSNVRLFPAIFGIDDINNIFNKEFIKEDKLMESKENRTDISNDSFIIELKTPKTKIFTKSNERNNISGLSKDLISGLNQLSLYCIKKDREKNLENLNFTKGVLIIGSNDEFLDENGMIIETKKLSWNLFRQNYKFEIVTFDDISKRVKNLKENIINLHQNNQKLKNMNKG